MLLSRRIAPHWHFSTPTPLRQLLLLKTRRRRSRNVLNRPRKKKQMLLFCISRFFFGAEPRIPRRRQMMGNKCSLPTGAAAAGSRVARRDRSLMGRVSFPPTHSAPSLYLRVEDEQDALGTQKVHAPGVSLGFDIHIKTTRSSPGDDQTVHNHRARGTAESKVSLRLFVRCCSLSR